MIFIIVVITSRALLATQEKPLSIQLSSGTFSP